MARIRVSLTDIARGEEAGRAHGEVLLDVRPTVTLHFSLAMKSGEALEIDGRRALRRERREGRRLVVHEHTSAPPPG